ncbi:DUF1015 family protein [Mucilaginibacter sp. X5P1]|uniref:DUF1015 family protein n=1 Tax=Mucilaginibacter sp. X5P1 TaxID=2723088 RepID=UPI00161DC984|nr:DUF1015 family protein [Mucilaginibacter sp. X5P1]MBB6137568.1 uncharacterized protein (DUF1015 family) [Mucilaginibacter sp. X5P1]
MEIKAFRAINPHPLYAEQFIFGDNNLKASLKSADGNAYLDLLLREGAYQQVREAQFYIFQVEENGLRQTGVWALVATEDYRAGRIKKHEAILPEKVKAIIAVEGKPVLLTYLPDQSIASYIADVVAGIPYVRYDHCGKSYKIWLAGLELAERFKQVTSLYVADGHHRLEGATASHISAILMSGDQLKVLPYHRYSNANFDWEELNHLFLMKSSFSDEPVYPHLRGRFGMRLDGQWYELVTQHPLYAYDSEFLAAEVFKDREVFFGHDLTKISPNATVFTLCPLEIGDVIRIADVGEILPAKSTWIEPKLPFGLLVYRHQTAY